MELSKDTLFHNRYKLLKKLGQGAFGEVWLANDIKMGKNVAVKIYVALDDDGLEDFRKEIQNTYNLKHSNLIHANHYDDCDGCPYLVMPYCANGSATKLPENITENTVWRFIRDVASGLAYLHNRTPAVIHQDIKPANILIDDDGSFLITDFGLSKELKTTMSQQSERAVTGGTVAFMAPERFSKTPITIKASDIFSLGVSAYYIVMGILPFAAQGGIALFSDKVQVPDIDTEKYSKELNSTISACMAKEAWDRPTAEELEEYANAQLAGRDILPPWENRLKDDDDENAQEKDVDNEKNKRYRKLVIGISVSLLLCCVFCLIILYIVPNDDKNKELIADVIEENSVLTAKWSSDITGIQKLEIEKLISNMVKVQGDTFDIGAQSSDKNMSNYDAEAQSDEAPVHKVVLDDYYIGKYEVTQGLWQAVMGENPSHFNSELNPVESVSYNDCLNFITKLNALSGISFALPTEAQWEYAARGGNNSDGYKYSGSDVVDVVAWYDADKAKNPHPVGSHKANELGLYDMSGNVWEWCSDYYHSYSESPDDVVGEYRIIRGGGWNNDAKYCRISVRYFSLPDYGDSNRGLRLVVNP